MQCASEAWTEPELFELCRLSWTQADAVVSQDRLDEAGYISYGGKPEITPMENPVVKILHSLNATITVALRRLGIMSSSSAGDRRTQTAKAVLERQAARDPAAGDENDPYERSSLM